MLRNTPARRWPTIRADTPYPPQFLLAGPQETPRLICRNGARTPYTLERHRRVVKIPVYQTHTMYVLAFSLPRCVPTAPTAPRSRQTGMQAYRQAGRQAGRQAECSFSSLPFTSFHGLSSLHFFVTGSTKLTLSV
jgi:hypothetical protein